MNGIIIWNLRRKRGNEIQSMNDKRSSPLLIAGAWLVVLIPLGWGVIQTGIKSIALFQQNPTAQTSPERK
jgi:hypothetical protein